MIIEWLEKLKGRWGKMGSKDQGKAGSMLKDYTHISMILDASGSMGSIKRGVMEGFNGFIEQQKAEPGTASVSLILFEGARPHQVAYSFKDLQAVKPLNNETYRLGDSTPLLDAIGIEIESLGKQLAAIPEPRRPDRVIIAIVTDGDENSSTRFSREKIDALIKQQTEFYNWKFVFLSSDLKAMDTARGVGVQANSMDSYQNSDAGVIGAFNTLSSGTRSYRASASPKAAFSLRKESDDE